MTEVATVETPLFQLLPELAEDEYAALREDISRNGVRVPVDVDEDGNILDGHHRVHIADELGLGCPRRVLIGLTDEEKRAHALAVNIHRRQLSREQKRELIRKSLKADPQLSDRQHAERTGSSHPTVATVREELEESGDVEKLSTRTDTSGRRQPASRGEIPHVSERTDSDEIEDVPLWGGVTEPDLDVDPRAGWRAWCEQCGTELATSQAHAGFKRCEDCDSEGDHFASDFTDCRARTAWPPGACVICEPDEKPGLAPDETPMPEGQEDAEPLLGALDAMAAKRGAARAAVKEALDKHVPDPDGPRRKWQLAFLKAMSPASRLMAEFAVEQVAENADDVCLEELSRLARNLMSYRDRVQAAVPKPNNVRHLKAVS